MIADRTKGLMLATASGCLMSFFPLFFRELGYVAPLKVGLFTMFFMSFVFSLPTIWISKSRFRISRNGIYWVFLVGMCSLMGNAAYNTGLRWIEPAVAISIQRSELIMVAILAIIFLKEHLGYKIYLAISLSLIGLWVLQNNMVSAHHTDVVPVSGVAMMLLSALGFALMLLFSKFALKHASAPLINTYRLLMMLFVLMLTPNIFSELLNVPVSAWWLGLLCALSGPLGARLLMTFALNYLPMAQVSLMTLIAPALTSIWQWSFYGVGLSLNEIIGALLIVSASGIVIMRDMPTKPVITPSGS